MIMQKYTLTCAKNVSNEFIKVYHTIKCLYCIFRKKLKY